MNNAEGTSALYVASAPKTAEKCAGVSGRVRCGARMDDSVWKGRSLLVAGCGYLGGLLARRAHAAGAARVAGLVRTDASAARLRAAGIEAHAVDATGGAWHGPLAGAWDAVVGAVSPGGASGDAYRATYVGAASSLAAFAAANPVGALVWVSSTGVYPPTVAGEVDEDVAPDASPRAQALVEAERHVLGARARAVVLRLAGIYGPGRHQFLDRIRAGRALAGDPAGRVNLIQVADACDAVGCAMACAASGVFNVADGHPPTRGELAAWLAAEAGMPLPPFEGGAARADRIVGVARARARLGWEPRHADFRAGYAAILRGFAP